MTGHETQLQRMTANPDWVRVSGDLSILCNMWAGRRDLQVYLGRDGGKGKASAFFDPRSAQIEINSEDAFGKGSDGSLVGDLTSRMELAKYPVAGGLSLHESGHARHSTADWEELRKSFDSEAEWTVFVRLEETRIEGLMALTFPQDVGYLRASTRELLMGDDPAGWTGRGAAQLLVGRAEIGVLEASDVQAVETALVSAGWSPSVLTRLREIVGEFLLLVDRGDDLEIMVALAKELHALMPEDPAGDEDGEDSGMPSDLADAIADALGRAAQGGRLSAIEAGDRAESARKREEADAADRIQSENEAKARETFTDSGNGTAKVPSQLRTNRAPTGDERSAAVRLSRDLEKAKYRDRIETEWNTDVPPGKFNGGEAMRLDAARSVGGDTSRYKPFRTKRYEETDEPPLTVGIMSDVSGSMSAVQEAVGTAVWVMNEAVYRLDLATCAAVYFGERVYPGLRKGEHSSRVREWNGRDGWEDFDGAFRALDGELELLNGKGARLLVVVSDGQYGSTVRVNQAEARDRWVRTCVQNGVGVVWLQVRGQKTPVAEGPGIEIVSVGTSILDAIGPIGQACIRALSHASA